MAITRQVAIGSLLAISAFTLWGLFPIYWKQLVEVDPVEVLAHRVIWSVPFVVIVLLVLRRLHDLLHIIRNPLYLGQLCLTACLITTNWGIYIWAMAENKIIEASMGYFLSPIMSVGLGLLMFHERLSQAQWWAIAIASTGVLYMFIANNILPWVALALAASFALYGGLRKKNGIDAITGLLVETLLVMPLALAWLGYIYADRTSSFSNLSLQTDILLIGGGIITALPLMLFVAGTKHLQLSSIGILFYLTPSIQFIIGWQIYQEPLNQANVIAFSCIWTALAIFGWQSYSAAHQKHQT
ncbi:MAG: chloramphenicol-sensitive protein RarD [Parasphingorhabdus sp.]|jgi:chloramphenicol-sensitive protein RarD